MALSTAQHLTRFSDAIRELYRAPSLETLSQDFVSALAAVIPADRYSVNWLASAQEQVRSLRLSQRAGQVGSGALQIRNWFRYPEYPKEADITVFNRFMHEHPLFHHWKTNAVSTAKWSDFVALRDLREKAIYREYFKHAQVRYQLGTASFGKANGDLAVACSRKDGDFTEDEKHLLGMMLPHFEQVMRLARGRGAMERVQSMDALAANSGSAMILSDTGVLLFCNSKARELCERFLRTSDVPPAEIVRWLRRDHERPLRITNGDKTLIVECEMTQPPKHPGPSFVGGDAPPARAFCLLTFTEHASVPLEVALQSLGLTPREAEVLAWMAQGKRNGEIAIILGAKSGTVAKHAEHIFAKLQVENRSAAIARAWETTRA